MTYLLTALIFVAVAVAIVWIARYFARKDIDSMAMTCPKCGSDSICPVTDALWVCFKCNEYFSINELKDTKNQ